MSERWRWITRDSAGGTVGTALAFDSQAEAEAWLADNWTSLRDQGGTAVTLLCGEADVYEMSLGEP